MAVPKGTLHNHTREFVDAVMAAWREGSSYIQTAKHFGIEKNVVAGIVYRNRKPGKESTRSFFQERREARERPKLPPTRKAPDDRRPKWMLSHRTTAGARFHECQWISNEPSPDDACKCGAVTGESRVYCPAHEARAWRTVQAGEAA